MKNRRKTGRTIRWFAMLLASLMILTMIPSDVSGMETGSEGTAVSAQTDADADTPAEDGQNTTVADDVDEQSVPSADEPAGDDGSTEGETVEESDDGTDEDIPATPEENENDDTETPVNPQEDTEDKDEDEDNDPSVPEEGEAGEAGEEEDNDPTAPAEKAEEDVPTPYEEGNDVQDDKAEPKEEKAVTITITLDANGGRFPDNAGETEDLELSEDKTKLTMIVGKYNQVSCAYLPKRTGYALEGWSTKKGGVKIYQDISEHYAKTDITFYAVWNNPVKITFDANGGKYDEVYGTFDDYELNEDQTKLTRTVSKGYRIRDWYIPERDGYVLDGWSSKKGGKREYDDYNEILADSDKTVYAVWKKENIVTITYDANGGIFQEEVYGLGEDKTKLIISAQKGDSVYIYHLKTCYPAQRDGYILTGWSSKKGGKREYDINGQIRADSSRTLYAVWKKAVKVTFFANGGHFSEDDLEYYGYELSEDKTKLTVPAEEGSIVDLRNLPERTGFSLVRWSKTKNGNEIDEFRAYPNSKYYACWEKMIKITFHAKGGKFPEESKNEGVLSNDRTKLTVYYMKGEQIYLSCSPTKGNKEILGWSSRKNGKEPDKDGTYCVLNEKAYKDKDFYAVWAKSYEVTFEATGSLRFGNETLEKMKKKIPAGSTLVGYAPATMYVYDGRDYIDEEVRWSLKKNAGLAHTFDAGDYKVTRNVTLYPVLNEITVTWDANGGTFESSRGKRTNKPHLRSQRYIYGESVDPQSNELKKMVREGYYLAGWSKTKKNPVIIDFTGIHATKNTTYYAVWKKATNVITLKSNGHGKFFQTWPDSLISKDGKTLKVYLNKGDKLGSIRYNLEKSDDVLYDTENTGLSFSSDGLPIDTASYIPSGNMKLYVVKNNKNIKVTIDSNGGINRHGEKFKYSDMYSKGELFRGSCYPEAEKKGHIFVGWFTKAKGGQEVIPGRTKITKKMTVYARWKKIQSVKVTFDANGGRFDTSKYVTEKTVIMPKGGEIQNICKDGAYIPYSTDNNKGFAGWSRKKNGKIVELSKVDLKKDIKFYAVWKKGDNIADGRIEISGKRYEYTGKEVNPKVTVYDRIGNKLDAKQYSVEYADNIKAGDAYVTVTGKGKYSGKIIAPFKIYYNKKSDVKTASGNRKSLLVQYSKAKGADGYAVYVVNTKTGDTFTADSETTTVKIKNISVGTYQIYVLPYMEKGKGRAAERVYSEKAGNVIEKKVK